MPFTVAIVGRPNVGKSTLFNRLVGRAEALIHDRPGVTRDRREGTGRIADLEFALVDTAGFEDADARSLAGRMRAQTERAIVRADAILFLIDARAGIVPDDQAIARSLRKAARPVILLANKCEGKGGQAGLIEAHALGLGAPLAISAAHGEGLDGLYEALAPLIDAAGADPHPSPSPQGGGAQEKTPLPSMGRGRWRGDVGRSEPDSEVGESDSAEADDKDRPIRIAVVGRPNVGKSTLVNRLLGEERMLTGAEPGITRDAIASLTHHRGRPVTLVDTAGLRKKARIDDPVEKLAASDSIRAIKFAQVVVLVLDAAAILDRQDLALADLTLAEGRALVIAVNKWDAITDRAAARRRLRERLEDALPQAKGVAAVTMSALEGTGTDALMKAVRATYATWQRRIPTAQLNRWLAAATARNPPPMAKGGGRIRLRYATQVATRPPTFALFSQRADALPESYARYLVNSLRDQFDLPGVPIRLGMRKRDNPYAEK